MPNDFSTFVRRRRQELSKTQRQVAQACGVVPEMITFIESGRRRPDPERLPLLADALEVDRTALCRLALATWHPRFYAELVGEPVSSRDPKASDPEKRVSVELSREDADFVRSLQRLNGVARHSLQMLADQMANPPTGR